MKQLKETKSTCPYCGVGCGVIITSQGNEITGVRGDPQHPANFGRLCTKGSTLHLSASAAITQQSRLLHPMQRLARDQPLQRVKWDAALDTAAQKFTQIIQTHGPDAVGFYISGQLLTEDYYVFNKLAKGLIGSNNIDSNSRLCMSSAVTGYKQTLGSDAPPACFDDVNHAGTIFIVGANPAYAHPVLFRRIEAARQARPDLKIVVCDPRRTDTAEIADLFLPIQPGTDVMLFNGMLHIMLWEGWFDSAYIAAHTSGFEALKATVRDYTPSMVAQTCGITLADLLTAARLFAGLDAGDPAHRSPTLSLYCQGLNQSSSGSAKNAALINLHLATGQIGKIGSGPLSLTGQPNAMGGREVGGMANLMSGHRDLSNPVHCAEVAALWGVPSVPSKPGKTAVEMFQAAADGEIKALWIACTNPAQSMPDQATVRRALERAEFVVVQEAFASTATCAFADLLLPATTWGEKEGTVTNSERRISRVRAAVAAPGEARHDWQIAVDFGQRLRANTLFPYPSPESIWNEHRESTRGRDLNITGMTYAMLEQSPQQWPLREGQTQGLARLYQDGIFPTPDGRARFVNTTYTPVAEAREARYPFSLGTGRLRDQWHGMSRTGTLGRLFGHVPEPALQMHPQDMARRLLKEGDLVYVTSKRGSILVPLQASADLGLSQVFLPMHWGEEFLSGRSASGQRLAGVNALTTLAFCPDSKQPEFKHAAVKVLKAELPWSLLAMAWLPDSHLQWARQQLQQLMREFDFASCVPFSNNSGLDAVGQERSGLLFRASAHESPGEALLAQIESLLNLDSPHVLRYADKKRGQRRAALLQHGDMHTTLQAFMLAGDTRAQSWITTLLKDELPAHAYGRALLVPGAQPPVQVAPRGTQVCACFNVSDVAIQAQLRGTVGTAQERLGWLQSALKCGTNCGSCLPQLQRMLRDSPPMGSANRAS
ncbi:MAG: nitrate reductase [Gammaproteobacteria bacterium]|uniref:nitrate reductase n=1 Tax=Rhodoferax sp. TaxID=50421 RepID=UPI0017E9DD52|nr:nitrate reductase [Rhodoferax sp.]MBU3901003.1 nitrate reductase [Gammaproteobacteria bacterium]MBA3058305.1 molybdopterin-dependent oxidoreductase [Rhodoferax sp.]MBU3996768.1 nitrate reductase [Gammaproteobacteria bacterium]MBU4017677.1 nitrate reductase [Gammaproteobacteria bacterium]MBU4081120.1 nitrate reductase [Gammaproteobacteria bacterium]